jgi:hypothetical protein
MWQTHFIFFSWQQRSLPENYFIVQNCELTDINNKMNYPENGEFGFNEIV